MLTALAISCISGAFAISVAYLGGKAYACNAGGAVTEVPLAPTAGGSSGTADFTVSNYQSFVRTVSSQYLARVPAFSVRYDASAHDIDAAADTVMRDAILYDDTTTTSDLDYLKWNMDRYQFQALIYKKASGAYAIYTFTQIYRTTAKNEVFVNDAVADILGGLNVGSAGAYAKVKAVHDYIVGHVEYDWSRAKYTAYDALSSGETVCQGYSLLTYKMLSELGVPVRIVSGQGNGGAHGWNIVRVGQYWYNLDVTWDDTTGRTTKWFLRSDAAFSDHTRDDEYRTDAFYTQYPMSPADYDPLNDNSQNGAPSVWAKGDVDVLGARGVVPAELMNGYQNSITRAEFTALISNVYEYAAGLYTATGAPPFTDIGASPYAAQISKSYELGIIGGTGGLTFTPEGTLTREQCAKIVSAAAGVIIGEAATAVAGLPFSDTGAISGWALPYVCYAYENGLMTGAGDGFNPSGVLTREQAMVIAERMIEKYGW
jgi:transglutaminase-like putative cysteine protease